MSRPRLLVSIRSAQEVPEAAAADLLDLKEPLHGSLGMASPKTFLAVARAVAALPAATRPPLSAAFGEVTDWENAAFRSEQERQFAERKTLLGDYRYFKLGLAGLANQPRWQDRWQAVRAVIECLIPPANPTWVAVAYADAERAESPPIWDVVRAAQDAGCGGLLIDTAVKDGLRLGDFLTPAELNDLIAAAHRADLFVALAGRLSLEDLSQRPRLPADIWAVRTAACAGDVREGMISRIRVRACRENLLLSFE